MEEPISLKQCLPPVGATNARLLILGSLPGDASLAAARYYAHPANQFWRLLGSAIGEPLDALDYDCRLERLERRGIALWDVIGDASRSGSLDGAIRGARTNPLEEFVRGHPALRAIAFNGQTAARLGRRALAEVSGIDLVDLPSSSPAYTLGLADKAHRWAVLGALASPR